MISANGTEYIKGMCETQADMIPKGVIYFIADKNNITWRKGSAEFDLKVFQVGEELKANSASVRAMKEREIVIDTIPRAIYGMRLRIMSEPIVDDNGEAVGVFSAVFPLMHPLTTAFNVFAPILCDMFPDGSVMFRTDLTKFGRVQHSEKFQLPQLVAGENLGEDSVINKVINTKKAILEEYDASVYGVPTLAACHPLFSEETGEIVGTFGLIIPKVAAVNLREMSKGLQDNLTQVASTTEELAASASNIHVNEQSLNRSINEIINLSQEINKITSFIKEIADETKMLGLNAAIEAARAGEVGKGFGVVAGEIRKLSEQSKSTVPRIQKITNEIINKVNESSERSQSSLASSQEQAAATEEITSSIEEITSMANRLNEIALKL